MMVHRKPNSTKSPGAQVDGVAIERGRDQIAFADHGLALHIGDAARGEAGILAFEDRDEAAFAPERDEAGRRGVGGDFDADGVAVAVEHLAADTFGDGLDAIGARGEIAHGISYAVSSSAAGAAIRRGADFIWPSSTRRASSACWREPDGPRRFRNGPSAPPGTPPIKPQSRKFSSRSLSKGTRTFIRPRLQMGPDLGCWPVLELGRSAYDLDQAIYSRSECLLTAMDRDTLYFRLSLVWLALLLVLVSSLALVVLLQ
jgi:hypothetical protein